MSSTDRQNYRPNYPQNLRPSPPSRKQWVSFTKRRELMYRFEVETVQRVSIHRSWNPRWPFAPLDLKLSTPWDRRGRRKLETRYRLPRDASPYFSSVSNSTERIRSLSTKRREIPWNRNEKLPFEGSRIVPPPPLQSRRGTHPSTVNLRRS